MHEDLVYLAGGLSGLTYEKAMEWRLEFQLLLPGVKIINPMRGRSILKNTVLTALGDPSNPLITDRAICTQCRFDVRRSTVVVANFQVNPKLASLGTAVEFGWADAFSKPVVAIMGPDNIHNHCMIKDIASYIVPTVEQAAMMVRVLLDRGN